MATAIADKVLRYTINDTAVQGDLKALVAALKTDLRVVDNGIGRGEAAGVPYNDVQLDVEDYNEAEAAVEITDESPEALESGEAGDIEILLETLLEEAGVSESISFSDDDDVDCDDETGRAYVSHRGTGVSAEFKLTHKVLKSEGRVVTLNLTYEGY